MAEVRKCRAKEPRSCRVHGFNAVINSPERVLYDSEGAAKSYHDAEKRYEEAYANGDENLAGAYEEREAAKLAYDASPKGLSDLESKLVHSSGSLSFLEQTELKLRAEKAKAHRENVLLNHSTFRTLYDTFYGFVQGTGSSEYVFAEFSSGPHEGTKAERNGFARLRDKLESTPHGTNLAIKTKDGGYIYGKLQNEEKKGFKKFLSLDESGPLVGKDVWTSVQLNNGTLVSLRNIETLAIVGDNLTEEKLAKSSPWSHKMPKWTAEKEGMYLIKDKGNQFYLPGKGKIRSNGEIHWESPLNGGYTPVFSPDAEVRAVSMNDSDAKEVVFEKV